MTARKRFSFYLVMAILMAASSAASQNTSWADNDAEEENASVAAVSDSMDPVAGSTTAPTPTPLLHASTKTPPVLTIAQAVSMALDRNVDVQSARSAVRQASENTRLAKSHLLPTLAGVVNADRYRTAPQPYLGAQTYNELQGGLQFTQPLFDTSLIPGLKYYKSAEIINEYTLQVAERTLSESVIENFYSVILAERLGKILKDTLVVDQETLRTAVEYQRIGRAQTLDVLTLQTQTDLLPPQIAQEDDLARTAAAQLALLLRELGARLQLKGVMPVPEASWVRRTVAKEKSELPEVLAAKETTHQFDYTRSITMATYYPKLNLLGSYDWQAFHDRPNIVNPNTDFSFGLQLNVPLFNGLGSIFQRKVLNEQETQVQLSEAKTTDTATVNTIQTEKDFEVAETQLRSARLAAVYGRKSLAEGQRLWKRQTISYLQFQSAQQAFLTAETGYYQAKYNYIVSAAKYFNALGVPISGYVAKLDVLSLGAEE